MSCGRDVMRSEIGKIMVDIIMSCIKEQGEEMEVNKTQTPQDKTQNEY